MILKLEPETKEKTNKMVKDFYPKIDNPIKLEFRKIFYYSFKKKYELTINDQEKNFLEILIVDGSKKKNIIQMFTRTMTNLTCSCKMFNESELGYCDHVATIQRIIKDQDIKLKNKQWLDDFNFKKNSLVDKIENYKGPRFIIYNPRDQKEILIGIGNNEPIKSINYQYFQPKTFQEQFDLRLEELNKQGISSAGLLSNTILYDYQEDIFKKMIAAKRGAMSISMGGGKSICSIACYEYIRQTKNNNLTMLIVAPKALKIQWSKEIKKRINIDCYSLNKEKDIEKYINSGNQIAVCTYQFVQRYVEKIKLLPFDVVLADEIQFVKNRETKAWIALSKIKSEYFFALSGTFIENSISDLQNIMTIIQPKLLGPKWKFEFMYQNILVINNHQVIYKGTRNIDKLKEKLKPVVFSFDNLKLPEIQYYNEFIDLTDKEQNIHDEWYDQAKILLSKSMNKPLSPGESMKLQSYLTRSRQACNTIELIDPANKISSAKIEKYKELVEKYCINNNEKIVVFSGWTTMLDILERETLTLFPTIKPVIYSGELNIKQREKVLTEFETNPDCKVLLISDAGNSGIDRLQFVSRTVINFEAPWTSAKLDQRNARIWRIGQKNEVHCYCFFANNSIDMQIFNAIERKREIRQEVMY